MADFSKLIVTNKGKELIAKALANAAVITFTKVSSSGTAYHENELEILTDLEDIRQTSLISDVSLTSNTSVEIQASFTNMELTEGYYLRALGLFAEDPDVGEILYGVTSETSGNCYIPAYNGVTSSGIYLQFVTAVGNAENVSLEINPAAIATIKDIQKIEEKLKILDFDDSGEVEGITSFTDFLESFVKGTSIYQFFANFRAGLKYVLHTGKLVNSGMCETPGEFALDAAYGKTLQDQITGLYSEIVDKLAITDDFKHSPELHPVNNACKYTIQNDSIIICGYSIPDVINYSDVQVKIGRMTVLRNVLTKYPANLRFLFPPILVKNRTEITILANTESITDAIVYYKEI